MQIEGESEPKKKKSRNKTGFPDPQEEALLSDQARKGQPTEHLWYIVPTR